MPTGGDPDVRRDDYPRRRIDRLLRDPASGFDPVGGPMPATTDEDDA